MTLKRDGYRFIPLEDLPACLASADTRPFACFTLDDGYRNNLDHALPVFERHGVPFTVFVTAGYIDRSHTLWWETLADLLSVCRRFRFDFGAGEEVVASENLAQKQAAFDRIAAYVHGSDEAHALATLNRAAQEHGIDPLAITERLTLDEAGLRSLVQASLQPRRTQRSAIAHLRAWRRRGQREISASAERVGTITGRRPTSFAYPYGTGSRFRPAIIGWRLNSVLPWRLTTQPGMLSQGCNPMRCRAFRSTAISRPRAM